MDRSSYLIVQYWKRKILLNNIKDNYHVIHNRSCSNSFVASWAAKFLHNGWSYSRTACNSSNYDPGKHY